MIQEIIDGLTQEKLQYHLTESRLNYLISEAKMFVIESVYWYEKVKELNSWPRSMEESRDWSAEKSEQEIDLYYMRAKQEINNKRLKLVN